LIDGDADRRQQDDAERQREQDFQQRKAMW
jgi:hypothetical protein